MDNNNYIETSYILREYYKGFKSQPADLMKIRDKINKIDRNIILDTVVKQNSEIYNLIAENYSSTINKFEKISEQINQINDQLTNVYNDNIALFSIRTSDDEHSLSNENDKEPVSIKQLNSNINENLNKIQQLQNNIQAKNNAIENKLNQIKDDETFMKDVEDEIILYIENISEDVFSEMICKFFIYLGDKGFIYLYLYKLIIILFDHILKINLNEDTESFNDFITNDKIKAKIVREFKREIYNKKFDDFKNKLYKCHSEFYKLSSDKLREINIVLDNLKIEAEEKGRDEIYNNFFFPLYKTLKLAVFISLGRIRVDKIKGTIDIDRDDMFTFDIKIKELIYSNSIMERLKTEISRKYEIRNSNENEYSSYRSSDIVSQINSTNNKSKQKDAITKLKSLHNDLEHDYILLLKNLSRKILKPKDLIKKPDPEMIAKNIK